MANLAAELKQFFGSKTIDLFLGVVKPCTKRNAARVLVYKHVLDERIFCYFEEVTSLYAYDPQKISKTGDLVLVKKLLQPKSTLITHELLKVVYPFGDYTDPVSGRKVMKIGPDTPVYRDDVEKLNEIYGPSPRRFIYDKAPPRGWQEGKKDFSDKEIHVNVNDDGVFDPYKRYL